MWIIIWLFITAVFSIVALMVVRSAIYHKNSKLRQFSALQTYKTPSIHNCRRKHMISQQMYVNNQSFQQHMDVMNHVMFHQIHENAKENRIL